MRNTCSLESQVVTNGNDDADSGAFVGPGGRLQLVLFASAGCESPSMLERLRPVPSSFRSPCEFPRPRSGVVLGFDGLLARCPMDVACIGHPCIILFRYLNGLGTPRRVCVPRTWFMPWLFISFKSMVVSANGSHIMFIQCSAPREPFWPVLGAGVSWMVGLPSRARGSLGGSAAVVGSLLR